MKDRNAVGAYSLLIVHEDNRDLRTVTAVSLDSRMKLEKLFRSKTLHFQSIVFLVISCQKVLEYQLELSQSEVIAQHSLRNDRSLQR